MKDEIFYLPKHPINEEKHILRVFYSNEPLQDIVHFAYSMPITFSKTEELGALPIDESVIKLSYKRIGHPNCMGVSKYELLEENWPAMLKAHRAQPTEKEG